MIISNVNSPITRYEVKRNLLLSNIIKTGLETKDLDIVSLYHSAIEDLDGLTEDQLELLIGSKRRIERYNALDWHIGTINFNNAGSWPKMQQLDERLTTGSLIETANGVGRVISGGNTFYVPTALINKLESIISNKSFIYPRLKPTLVPGGTIRKDERTIRIEMVSQPEAIKTFSYDIEDGNTRLLAYALSGFTEAEVYFGVKK